MTGGGGGKQKWEMENGKFAGVVGRDGGGSGGGAKRADALGDQPVEARGAFPQAGDGLDHGHTPDKAVRRGVDRSAALGLRGSVVQAGQGRGAEGAKAAVRPIRLAVRKERNDARLVHRSHRSAGHQ